MYNFISLKVKCPHCNHSLMDDNKLVDHEASIKLNIKIGDKTGVINLSSIYGSYNYVCDIATPDGEIAEFYCPHCNEQVIEEENCKICDAPMIPLTLDMGGVVSICSRSGCKNHAIEFEDLSVAIKKIYQEYGFRGREYPKDLDLRGQFPKHGVKIDEEKEIIESGTFLNSYCPHCKKSLIDHNMLKLKILDYDKKESGYVMLSPYLNVYSTKSTIFLKENKPVGDIKCFHCDKSLIVEDKSCELCNSSIAKISIGARTRLIDFYICSKKGCKWHGLSKDDLYDIKLEDSMEW